MRAFTVFFALVVGLTWALTVVADPEPLRIRNPFRRAGLNDLETADEVHVRTEKKEVVESSAKTPLHEKQIQQRRRSFYSQTLKAKAKNLSIEKVTIAE